MGAFAVAIALAVQAPAAIAQPSLAGVWDGTIGNLPVRVCFNVHDYGTTGGYYYRSHLLAIALQQSDKDKRTFTEGVAEADAKTPLWTITRVEGDIFSGDWRQGTKSLPISLKRLPAKEKADSPCESMLFHGPRLEGVRTISKPAAKDGVPYTRLLLDHRGHFGDDVSIESFALNDDSPATRAINTKLRKLLADGTDGWFDCIRMAWNSGSDGYTGLTLSPRMISRRWLSAMNDVGWYCGGAHPDDAQTPMLFDRRTGKEVDVLQWFSAKAIKREKFEQEPTLIETLQPAFRKMVLTGWKPEESGCRDVIGDQDFWTAELTRTGFIFTPDLPHVDEGCTENFKVPFAKLAPYLTPKGKAEVAALQAEVASRR